MPQTGGWELLFNYNKTLKMFLEVVMTLCALVPLSRYSKSRQYDASLRALSCHQAGAKAEQSY